MMLEQLEIFGKKSKVLSIPFTLYQNKFQADHRFKHKNKRKIKLYNTERKQEI